MHFKTNYSAGLRTNIEHIKSGERIITDAPVDNNGKGASFSPTDLVTAALTSCMMTIMGIEAAKMGLELEGLSATTEKVMSAAPRKISKIRIKMHWDHPVGTPEQIQHLKDKAITCPVALSLSSELKQEVDFSF